MTLQPCAAAVEPQQAEIHEHLMFLCMYGRDVQDVGTGGEALVGTASKGMGVQKVLTHVLLLCGRLEKRCVIRKMLQLFRDQPY